MVFRKTIPALVAFALLCGLAAAQRNAIPVRINQTIDEGKHAVLRGNTYPLALPKFDRGPAPPDLPLDRVLLVLQRSPEQEAVLKSLLEQQQQKSSPSAPGSRPGVGR